MAGSVAAGFLGQTVGIIPVLAVQGGGYVAAGLLVVVTLYHAAPARPGLKSGLEQAAMSAGAAAMSAGAAAMSAGAVASAAGAAGRAGGPDRPGQ